MTDQNNNPGIQSTDTGDISIKGGEWTRETLPPEDEARPLPAPDDQE